MSGYVELPAGWSREAARGPAPFVTAETFRAPDGHLEHWSSRAHRKRSAARRVGRSGSPAAGEPVWWRPRRREWWMAVLFSLGSLCFALGGLGAQWLTTLGRAVDVTFFVGSLFFTGAAYLQYAEAVNASHDGAPGAGSPRRWRPASWEPGRIDWLASLVQFVGTLFFNVTTFTALKHGFDSRQMNVRVWAPDAVGSAAFLVSSELAYAEVCHRWLCFSRRTLAWRIVALNLAGSIAFGLSAIGSYSEPATGEPLAAHLANAGTSLGGFCFLAASLLLMPESARAQSAAAAPPPALRSAA